MMYGFRSWIANFACRNLPSLLMLPVFMGLLALAGSTMAATTNVGVFQKADCTTIANPVAEKTYCFDSTANTLKKWNGSAWVDMGGQSRGVVIVKDYGAKGDGVADDTAAIQRAINAGRTIYFPPGTYRLASVTDASSGDIYALTVPSFRTLVLNEDATLKYAGGTTPRGRIIMTIGSPITGATAVTSNASAGALTVNVTSATGLTIGRDVQIRDTNHFEMNRIASIAGLAVTLEAPTQFAYLAANSATVQQFSFAEHIHIIGGTFDGGGQSGDAIEMFDTKYSSVEKTKILNLGSGSMARGLLAGGRSHHISFLDNDIRNTPGQGIEVYTETSQMTIAFNRVWQAAIHGIAIHGEFQTVTANQVYGSGSLADTHANIHVDTAYDVTISDNRVAASRGRGIQTAGGTITHIRFIGNHIESSADVGMYLSNANDLTVAGNDIVNNLSSGLYLTRANRVTVSGNNIRGNANDGIRINTGNEFQILGNNSTGNTGYGIQFLTSPTGTSLSGNYLSGNTIAPMKGTYTSSSVETDTGDTRYSGSEMVVRKLADWGAQIRVHDPYVGHQYELENQDA